MKNEKYLNPIIDFNSLESFNNLNDIGFFKLWVIRTMSIYYRHILQYWLYKNKNDLTSYGKYIYTKRNYNAYSLLLEFYLRATKRLHKIGRQINKIKIDIYFDFDNTITDIVSRNKSFDFIHYKILKSIFGSIFLEYINKFDTCFDINFHILTASGDKEGIKKYLIKHNLTGYFNNIKICSGTKNKSKEMKLLNFKKRDSLLILVDDDKEMCKIASLNFFIPVHYKKYRFKCLTEEI